MLLKTLSIAISFSFFNFAHSEVVDYSKGNTNSYKEYSYNPSESWQNKESSIQKTEKPGSYFDNNITNPISIQEDKQLSCWDKAGYIYKVDPWLLLAVAKVESNFNPKAININKNKTTDVGLMQINTFWLPTLKKYGIEANHLFNPCISIFVGAWIMAQNIKHYGYNQDGIGAYNSPNLTIRRKYAQKVYIAYNQLTKQYKK